jgi:hypothetical protein
MLQIYGSYVLFYRITISVTRGNITMLYLRQTHALISTSSEVNVEKHDIGWVF